MYILNMMQVKKAKKQTKRIQFLISPELLSKISIKTGIRKKDINQYLESFIEMSFKNQLIERDNFIYDYKVRTTIKLAKNTKLHRNYTFI